VGCGNAVLRIYSNKSTMPSHELCGKFAEKDDKEIVTATNSVRFKSVDSFDDELSLHFHCILFHWPNVTTLRSVYGMSRPSVVCLSVTLLCYVTLHYMCNSSFGISIFQSLFLARA